MSNKAPKFILSGGGTGGHIFPAVSIADALKAQYPNCEILFVGAEDRMEMQKVPEAGYNIKGLWISGIQRANMLKNLNFPFKVLSSLKRCRAIIKDFKPDAVIGTGGFASGPLLYVAQQKNIPTVIQEQNSYPGITNKLLSKKAHKICVAYPNLETFFPSQKIVFTGNPIRQNLINAFSQAHNNTPKQELTLLVLGGSLGARSVNNQMLKCYQSLLDSGIKINWQCGKLYADQLKSEVKPHKNLQLNAFLTNMTEAYSQADIIVSRAGAGTISELCVVGKPVILVPSPNVAEDHQTKNAQAISNKEAAILLAEKNLEQLENTISALAQNTAQRNSLSQNIKALAKPNATLDIVNEIIALIP